jgi:Holliday junction resolvase RusA-like endonuclease
MAHSEVRFFVPGVPAPQGSKIPITRGGKTVLIEAAKGFKVWRDAVVLAANTARNNHFVLFDEPIRVEFAFALPKPPTTKYVDYPAGKPDLDKLCRNTADGLTVSALIKDDARIVDLVASKRWAVEGEPTGCWVVVTNVTV